ncbi:MAG: glycosyltransferase [Bacteroidetes bacterium]|nr:glycosyltransferase [Bacteroidota bacterium]
MTSRKMDVAIVYHFFAHYRGAVIQELIKSDAHHYVFVGARKDPQNSGIKAFEFNDPARFIETPYRIIAKLIFFQGGLIRLALNPRFDAIVYLGDAHYVCTWISAILARISGKRVLFWTHGWLREEKGLMAWMRCVFYRLANGLLLYGHRAVQFGLAKGFKSKNLYVVYNSLDTHKQEEVRSGITTQDIRETREKLFGHWNKPVVICTGRLLPLRQLDLLFEAAASLQADGCSVDVLIIGDGPERSRLEMIARNKNINAVFYGACYEETTLARLIMSSNVMVIPGAIGLTVMHSLIYGTPVITHDDPDEQGPEWEAIKSGINGQLFKKGDSSDLAKTIRAWVNGDLPDENIRKRCIRSIDRCYTPAHQVQVINASVEGKSADIVNSESIQEQVIE